MRHGCASLVIVSPWPSYSAVPSKPGQRFSCIARQAGTSPFTTCREDIASGMRDAWLLSGERTKAPVVGRASYRFPMGPVTITGHQAVRQALRDVATWSSDLQGDADVRDYRQIPLEVDPPDHHRYRTALSPYFVRPRIDGLVPHFEHHAREILGSFEAAGGGDVVSSVALPYVVRCLGDIYCRPQDVDEWMSWGPDVWQADGEGRLGTCPRASLTWPSGSARTPASATASPRSRQR